MKTCALGKLNETTLYNMCRWALDMHYKAWILAKALHGFNFSVSNGLISTNRTVATAEFNVTVSMNTSIMLVLVSAASGVKHIPTQVLTQ
jgi:hypothetical protein